MRTATRSQPSLVMLGVAALLALPADAPASEPNGDALEEHTVHGAVHDGAPRVSASLVAERHGDSLRAGVLLEMDEGWHVYWKNPGQTGLATEVSFALDDADFGVVEWPAPEVFSEADGFIISYGYSGDVVLAADAAIASDGEVGAHITAVVDYLACASVCIPGRHELRLPVPAEGEPEPVFERHRRPMVEPPGAHGLTMELLEPVAPVAPGETFSVSLVLSAAPGGSEFGDVAAEARFVPERVAHLRFDGLQAATSGDGQRVHFTLSGRADIDGAAGDANVRGVLGVPVGDSLLHLAVEFEVPRTNTPQPPPETTP